jgi:RHS repeat-associated protein
LFELGDHLGSTSVVLDKATSELVEASTYQGYGAKESDYRPDRWKGYRDDYGFTGKEEDAEFGVVYFGKRFYSPGLNRWVTADPLAVHAPGRADLNLYAYVHGRVLKSVDPLGLEDGVAGSSATDPNGGEQGSGSTAAPRGSYNSHRNQWRIGALYYANAHELGYSLVDIAARRLGKLVCGAASGVCDAAARAVVRDPSNPWKERLYGEYAKGGAPSRTLKLSVGEARDWITRGEATPLNSQKFVALLEGARAEFAENRSKDVTFQFSGYGGAEFAGPGGFSVHWDISVTIHAGNASTTYAGTAKVSDRYDFDPTPLRDASQRRDPNHELLTRAGQALSGTPYNIESGTLAVTGSLASAAPTVTGEVAPPSAQKGGKQ